jgi:hypothetical protein
LIVKTMTDRCMQIAIVFLSLGAVATLTGAGLILFYNSGSRNIALAFGTLVGAFLFFGTQVLFDLRPTSDLNQISMRYAIDLLKPEIRQWRMPRGMRGGGEIGASNWLASKSPQTLRSRDKSSTLAMDLTMFSLLYMIGTQEFDWQLKKNVYQDEYGTVSNLQALSPPEQCTKFSVESLKSILSVSGNMFSGAPLTPISSICLPPDTTMTLTTGALIISNPYCQLSFRPGFVGMDMMNPEHPQGPADLNPKLEDNGGQFVSVMVRLDVETRFLRLRSQSSRMPDYRAWCDRLIRDAQQWWNPANVVPLGVRSESTNPLQSSR